MKNILPDIKKPDYIAWLFNYIDIYYFFLMQRALRFAFAPVS